MNVSNDLPSPTGLIRDAFTCLEYHFGRLVIPDFFGRNSQERKLLANRVKRAKSLDPVREDWIKGMNWTATLIRNI